MISAAFFHLSLMHILFNCMTLHNVGSAIEARVGTLSFSVCTLILIPGCGIANVAASWTFNLFGYEQSMSECAAGFSGVLFAYVTIQALYRDSAAYSIYGFFSVPAKWYPLCMLVITQIVLPQSSFVGHFGGILAGVIYSIVERHIPSFFSCFQRAESLCNCPALSSFCFFIPHPAPPSTFPVRFIPGIIIGDSFLPSHHPNQAPVEAATENTAQQSAQWLARLRSLFPSRFAPNHLPPHVSSSAKLLFAGTNQSTKNCIHYRVRLQALLKFKRVAPFSKIMQDSVAQRTFIFSESCIKPRLQSLFTASLS